MAAKGEYENGAAARPSTPTIPRVALASYSIVSGAVDNGDALRISSEEVEEGCFVHPKARILFAGRFRWVREVPVFGRAIECYGPRLILSLSLVFFLFKGMSYQTLMHSLYPMFHERFKSTTVEYQRFRTVSTMGWSIKPFTALISDAFALWGYKKRWLLTFSSAFGALCSVIFALLPPQRSSAIAGSCISFLVGYGQANLDILLEGLYARKMAAQPQGGASIVSAVWIAQTSAGILAAVVQGPLSDAGLSWVGNIIGGLCMAACVPVFLFNWVEEDTNRDERVADARKLLDAQRRSETLETADRTMPDPVPEDSIDSVGERDPSETNSNVKTEIEGAAEMIGSVGRGPKLEEDQDAPGVLADPVADVASREVENEDDEEENYYDIPTCCAGVIEFNKEVLLRNFRVTVSSVCMTVIVVVMAVVTTLYDGIPLLAVVSTGTIFLTIIMFWALPLVVAKAGLFACLYQGLYIIITSPLDSFYLAEEACLEDGPHFSYFFYNTISGVVGNVAALAGIVGFSFIFSKRSYRLTFIVTVAAEIVASMFDLIIVKRWNIAIGIPDHYMYIFGDAVVYQVAYMLSWMPLFILLAQLCPHGSESMVFALLVSFFNHGKIISGTMGALLMDWAWPVIANDHHCDFTQLWKLVLVGHMALPLLIIPAVFCLIPSARVCDELDSSGMAIKREREERTVP